MDFIAQQSGLLKLDDYETPTLYHSTQSLIQQVDSIDSEHRNILDQIKELETCEQWLEKQQEIEHLIASKCYSQASELTNALQLELNLYPNSQFALSVNLPDVNKLCEKEVLGVWMPRAWEVGNKVGSILCAPEFTSLDKRISIDDAIVHQFVGHSLARRLLYQQQRLVLLGQLKQLDEIFGFFWVEHQVGVFSKARQRELWVQVEKNQLLKPICEPIDALKLSRFMQRTHGVISPSPKLVLFYRQQGTSLQQKCLAEFQQLCDAKIIQEAEPFRALELELERNVLEVKAVCEWLGLPFRER